MTRYPAVAGTFYPSSPLKLKTTVEDFLRKASPSKPKNKLRAIVVPHAGYIYSGPTAAYAYKLIPPAKKVFLIGPAHYVPVEKFAFSKEKKWKTPLGEIKLFQPIENPTYDNEAHTPEHSLEVQLPFLQTTLKDFEICPILINNKKYSFDLAKLIKDKIDDDTIIVISSDLSHFHSLEDANKIDSYANNYIPELNIEKTERTVEACGVAAILSIMHLAKELGWKGELLKYQTSANTSGDKYNVVGYGSYAFY